MHLGLIAHAGESHDESLETLSHGIELTSWFIAVPVFILLSVALAYSIWVLSKKNIGTVLLLMSVVMLVVGFSAFKLSAAISIIAITAGLIMTLVYTFGSLSAPSKK